MPAKSNPGRIENVHARPAREDSLDDGHRLIDAIFDSNCSSNNRAWVAVRPSSVKAFGRSSLTIARRRAGDRREVHRVSMPRARVRIGSKQRS
jgi:hypothetical protein